MLLVVNTVAASIRATDPTPTETSISGSVMARVEAGCGRHRFVDCCHPEWYLPRAAPPMGQARIKNLRYGAGNLSTAGTAEFTQATRRLNVFISIFEYAIGRLRRNYQFRSERCRSASNGYAAHCPRSKSPQA